MRIYQHQRCKNDTNGNPRRLFCEWDSQGRLTRVADEGYRGWPSEFGSRQQAVEITDVRITPEEYRDTIRFAKQDNCFLKG